MTHHFSKATRFVLASVAALLLSGAAFAQAQNFPNKPVKVVVG